MDPAPEPAWKPWARRTVWDYHFCPACGGALTPRIVKAGEPERPVCEACGWVYYHDPKAAAGIVTVHEDRVVLLRRAIEPRYGAWVFPGGFVDRGEHPEAAAIREAREEAGVEVRVDGLLGVYHTSAGPIVIVYRGTVVAGEPAALDESLEAGLFAPDALPWDDLAFDTTRAALEDYLRVLGLPPWG